MLKYLVKRIFASITLLFIVIFVTFSLFVAVPADPARLSCGKTCDPETRERIRHAMEIDIPVYEQYFRFMKGIVVGRTYNQSSAMPRECKAPCLGFSFRSDEDVTETIKRRAPITFSLALGASVVWLIGGILLGMASAIKRGKFLDKLIQGFALFFSSLQIYLIGWIASLYLVIKHSILPTPIYISPFDSLKSWIGGMLLPWLTLAFISMASYARLTRSGMLETMSEDFVRTARASGITNRSIQFRHTLRAAITPIVTIFGLDLGSLLGGAVITESTFGLKGVGTLALEAVYELDLPLIIGTVIFGAFFIILANLIVDILYAVLDPKVRITK